MIQKQSPSISERNAGLTSKEVLLAITVLLVFAAIVIPIFLRAKGHSQEESDVRRMRMIYSAWFLYQQDNFGSVPQDLYRVRFRLPSDDYLASDRDPFAQTSGPYPIEPLAPDFAEKSPIRISYGYLGSMVAAGKVAPSEWQAALSGKNVGLLASVWQGNIKKTGAFTATSSGPLLRVNMDGALMRISPLKHPTAFGHPEDAFGIPLRK